MFIYESGDLFESNADALINTVNCEGFMGKGLAHQFKKKYKTNYETYKQACDANTLQPGTLLTTNEEDKVIINFPTKRKWREKSKLEYIDSGLIALANLLQENKEIKSIAIPPLGCGNGGLDWYIVKPRIVQTLQDVSKHIDIYIYEPHTSIDSSTPHLTFNTYILLKLTQNLTNFDTTNLYAATFFLNIFANKELFKHSPNTLQQTFIEECTTIKTFKTTNNLNDNNTLLTIYETKNTSTQFTAKQNTLNKHIKATCTLINNLNKNENENANDLIQTYTLIQNNQQPLNNHHIDLLLQANLIEPSLLGYTCTNV